MSDYERRRRAMRVAAWTFAAALACLVAAILTADGWDLAQRLLALAAVLGFAALIATIAGAP